MSTATFEYNPTLPCFDATVFPSPNWTSIYVMLAIELVLALAFFVGQGWAASLLLGLMTFTAGVMVMVLWWHFQMIQARRQFLSQAIVHPGVIVAKRAHELELDDMPLAYFVYYQFDPAFTMRLEIGTEYGQTYAALTACYEQLSIGLPVPVYCSPQNPRLNFAELPQKLPHPINVTP